MLPKLNRLTARDIESLSNGKSAFTALISMRFMKAGSTKLSVTVSKKVAPRAVDRNRIRRRAYSLLAKIKSDIQEPVFALLMPKKEFLALPLSALEKEIRALFEKARLI